VGGVGHTPRVCFTLSKTITDCCTFYYVSTNKVEAIKQSYIAVHPSVHLSVYLFNAIVQKYCILELWLLNNTYAVSPSSIGQVVKTSLRLKNLSILSIFWQYQEISEPWLLVNVNGNSQTHRLYCLSPERTECSRSITFCYQSMKPSISLVSFTNYWNFTLKIDNQERWKLYQWWVHIIWKTKPECG